VPESPATVFERLNGVHQPGEPPVHLDTAVVLGTVVRAIAVSLRDRKAAR